MYKSCPLECKILKGIWKNAYANDNVFCTTLYILTFQILIFSSESLFSNPYLFLSLYFLLYIISVRGVGGGSGGGAPRKFFWMFALMIVYICTNDTVFLEGFRCTNFAH